MRNTRISIYHVLLVYVHILYIATSVMCLMHAILLKCSTYIMLYILPCYRRPVLGSGPTTTTCGINLISGILSESDLSGLNENPAVDVVVCLNSSQPLIPNVNLNPGQALTYSQSVRQTDRQRDRQTDRQRNRPDTHHIKIPYTSSLDASLTLYITSIKIIS